eukprot:4343462-Pleurochrysis_carterae.AAC.5
MRGVDMYYMVHMHRTRCKAGMSARASECIHWTGCNLCWDGLGTFEKRLASVVCCHEHHTFSREGTHVIFAWPLVGVQPVTEPCCHKGNCEHAV